MRFTTTCMAMLASAAITSAASVTFWTLDNVQRTIIFTPNPGFPEIEPVVVNNKKKTVVDFPDVYVGNYYAVADGKKNVPGMLGEVNFSGWNGLTYFDVSAIVNPHDHNGVKQMWPLKGRKPMSGCEVFPCDNCYWHSEDVQTKTTKEVDLVTTLGEGITRHKFAEEA